eukprot:5293656-Alexandrium_andersonii.AAC.1
MCIRDSPRNRPKRAPRAGRERSDRATCGGAPRRRRFGRRPATKSRPSERLQPATRLFGQSRAP